MEWNAAPHTRQSGSAIGSISSVQEVQILSSLSVVVVVTILQIWHRGGRTILSSFLGIDLSSSFVGIGGIWLIIAYFADNPKSQVAALFDF